MGYNLLINGVYWGYNPLILTIDPNFQRGIQEGSLYDTVDGNQKSGDHSPVEVGNLSTSICKVLYIPGGW